MLQSIRKMLTGAPDAPPSAATIASAIDVLDAKAAEARAALAAADDRRADAVLLGDAAAAEVRKTIAALAENLADMTAARGRLVERLAAARDAEAEAARWAAYDATLTKRDMAVKAVAKNYPRIRREALGIVRQIAEADADAETVNRNLPAGAAPIEPVEAFRDQPALPEEIVATEVSERWVARPEFGSMEVNPTAKGFVDHGDGSATFTFRPAGTSFSRTGFADKLVTTTRTLLPWTAGLTADRLATIRLPGMRPGDPEFDLAGLFGVDAGGILRALDRAAEETPEQAAPSRQAVKRSDTMNHGPSSGSVVHFG